MAEQARREMMLIGGEWVGAADGRTFEVTNPATGRPAAVVPEGKTADVDAAVTAAGRALRRTWRDVEGVQRGRLLRRVGELMLEHREELALRDTSEMGKPLSDARGDVEAGAAFFEFYGGLADKIFGRVNPVPSEFFNYTLREPVGVVGAIAPWNFPVWMAGIKLAPALACGCTVVLKPAEQSPGSALLIGRLCQEAGLPDGVVNIVTGDGPGAGAPLAAHAGVNHVSFTGSSQVGRQVAAAAAGHLAGVTCELGGKTANLVFADCNFEQAVGHAIHTICRNSGQICVAGSRLLVEQTMHDEFVGELCRRAERLKVGDPLLPDTHMGPIVSKQQFDKVMGYIEQGKQQGASLLTGGGRPAGMADWPYVAPTVFDNVRPDMTIAREEIFGPVLAASSFGDESEAIELANATDYGLAAWIWTDDVRRAHRLARRMEAGIVMVNQAMGVCPAAPYSGFKGSGMGHECGVEGAIDSYTRIKNVTIRLDTEPMNWPQKV
ncbi:MAG TPA: aldehyde dehydrogenase family protein [Phycisphaerae bacterium]|nr:aldehyde dehydrogenase family protein [Phycisphaerae bacterium]